MEDKEVCRCGMRVERRHAARHRRGFWHRRYRLVLRYLRDERSQSWIARRLGVKPSLLWFSIRKALG